MATPGDHPSFGKFSHLPLELRDQIWEEALPSITTTLALYFYRKSGFWQPFDLSKDDEGYREGGDNVGLRFRTDLVDSLDYQMHPLAVSLLWVNREARRVALKWMDGVGPIKTRYPVHCIAEEISNPVQKEVEIRPSTNFPESALPGPLTKYSFSLPFLQNPDLSTLYISRSKWREFYCEPRDLLWELPCFRGKFVEIYTHHLRSIAIPEVMIRNQHYLSWLPEMIDKWHYCLTVVYVILEDDDEQHLWSPPKPETAHTTSNWAGEEEEPPSTDDQPMGRTEAMLADAEQGPWGWELIPEKYQFTWSSHWGETGEIRPFIVDHALKFDEDYEEWVAEKSHLGGPINDSDVYDQMIREIEPLRKRIEKPVRLALEDGLSRYSDDVRILDIRPVRAVRH